MLEKWYPNLREEILFCTPEILWERIKHVTGLEIIYILDLYKKKKNLKRKIQEFPDSPNEEYASKHYDNM